MPVGAASFSEALRWGAECFHALKGRAAREGSPTAVGDEGGFAPEIATVERGPRAAHRGDRGGGLRARPARSPSRSIRAATRALRRDGRYRLERADTLRRDGHDRVLGRARASSFPIVSIEDGARPRTTGKGWTPLTEALGARCSSWATTCSSRTPSASSAASATASQRDPRQGEPDRHAHRDARRDRARAAERVPPIVSHRRGETEDTTIADLAVATNAGQIKTAAPCRGERIAKYNQLLRIEEELGDQARYAGGRSLSGAPPGVT